MKKSDTMKNIHRSPNTPSVRQNHLSLVYFNARSLFPKFDELCLLVATYNPYFIAIVETWLSREISDSEIYIHGYNLFLHDHNRRGGGVLLYVKDCFRAVMPSSFCTYNLEFLLIFIHYFGHKFCISVFYRPLNSSAYILILYFLL